MIPYLSRKIEAILSKQPQGLSEYELISLLQKDTEHAISEVNLQDSLALFQIHFLLFHCLYVLRDKALEEETSCLQISPLKIILLPYTKSMTEELTENDELRDYYLDLSHLENADTESVDDLLSSFWHRFIAVADQVDALAVMSLDEGVSFDQIKTRYKKLAMDHHPDRGGCAHTFASINQAMDVLRGYYQSSKRKTS